MDMLLAVLWDDGSTTDGGPDALRDRLHRVAGPPLWALGARELVLNVPDHHVADALIRTRVTPQPVAAVLQARLPVVSTRACTDLLEALRSVGPVSAWQVTDGEPLPIPAPGPDGRVDGMANLAFLRRPERLDRAEWLRVWLEEHTQVAIDTQSTVGYAQHVVVRALTDDAPAIDAFVEEVFPAAAATDLSVFFDAVGDDERLSANMTAMTESVARFLDDGTVDAVPTSRYVLRSDEPVV